MLLAHPSSVSSNVCGDGGSIKSIQDSEDIKMARLNVSKRWMDTVSYIQLY